MYTLKKTLIASMFFLILVFTSTQTVTAGPFNNDNSIAIGVIVAAVILIMAFFFLSGGIKYVTPDNVLDTAVRKNLYEYLDEYPGSHLREIARELKLKPSNAAWHLRKLEQTNLVRSRLIGGKKVFYLVEGGIDTRKIAIAESILRNENALHIMQYLYDHPGKHLLEIAHALDLNHHVVKWHLNKMQMTELIEGDTSHSAYPVYFPTEVGQEALDNFDEYLRKVAKVAS